MTKARDIASAAPAPSTVSATELGYLDGVTSAIQTQVDAKIAKTLTTTTGDIIYASGANTPARLGIGSSAQVLTVASGVPSWAALPATTPTFDGVRVYKNTYQSVPNNTLTALTWEAENYDTNSYHSTVTNTSRLTVPTTGYYLIMAFFGWEYQNAGTNRILYLYKNGSTQLQIIESPTTGSALNAYVPVYQGFTVIFAATAGDYFELKGYQGSGGGLGNVSNGSDISYFSMQYLGA
jgi:hypothetical protein